MSDSADDLTKEDLAALILHHIGRAKDPEKSVDHQAFHIHDAKTASDGLALICRLQRELAAAEAALICYAHQMEDADGIHHGGEYDEPECDICDAIRPHAAAIARARGRKG